MYGEDHFKDDRVNRVLLGIYVHKTSFSNSI